MPTIKYAILDSCIEKSHWWIAQPWIAKGAKRYTNINDVPKDSILVTAHYAPWWSPLKEWIEAGHKWIESDYGYWGHNLPRRNTRRVTYCGSHNLNIRTPAYSRMHTIDPQISDWRMTRGKYLLVIEPQQAMISQRTGVGLEDWKRSLQIKVKDFWDGDIVWRRKRGSKDPIRWPEYVAQLDGCYAVIGERTMACVEAAIMGYQAYTTDHSMVSLLMGNRLEDIKQIKTPDRHAWVEHIAWSQFTRDEFAENTKIADLVEQYQIF